AEAEEDRGGDPPRSAGRREMGCIHVLSFRRGEIGRHPAPDSMIRTTIMAGGFPGARARPKPDVSPVAPRYNRLQTPGDLRWRPAFQSRMNAKVPSPPRILVVDDDVRLRDLLTRYLSGQGFEVKSIADARELDRRLQRDPPSLLVLDLMLPGEDGLAICRRLRSAGEMVPIIMLTAKGEDVDRIVGLEMG